MGGELTSTTPCSPSSTNLRVTWNGSAPGQVYLQSMGTTDLSSYVDDGAVRFGVLVHSAGDGPTSVAAHCRYPCGAELNLSEVFADLPVGERATVTIPVPGAASAPGTLSCDDVS